MSTTHHLKTWPEFYWPVARNEKLFEFRKNDRDFKVGDYLMLKEWEPIAEMYTGHRLQVIVLYIAKNDNKVNDARIPIPPGWCIMSIRATVRR